MILFGSGCGFGTICGSGFGLESSLLLHKGHSPCGSVLFCNCKLIKLTLDPGPNMQIISDPRGRIYIYIYFFFGGGGSGVRIWFFAL
jgi:hypothetical protein